jgi:hypothetical protein
MTAQVAEDEIIAMGKARGRLEGRSKDQNSILQRGEALSATVKVQLKGGVEGILDSRWGWQDAASCV